ncbi:MAG: glycosyltransferase [Actinobacteria bacterium]|nr:glycosyltransferase [Actinomycetota bacterium]
MTGPRVVIIANNVDEVGGAQRVVHVVAQQLALRGHPVDLVGVTPFEPRHDFVAEPAYRRFTLMSQQWPAPPAKKGLSGALSVSAREREAMRARLRREAVRSLAAVLDDGPPGVIVTAQLWAMEHLAEVQHDAWAVIGQYHSSYEAAASGRDLPRALALYADVDLFTLLTREDADSFRRAGLNNTTWLANPLAFWPELAVAARETDAGVVTYLGRLSTEKGVGFLVDAWGRLAERFPGWRLRLVGSGPDEKAVRARISGLAVGSDRIDVVPPVADVERELRGSDLLVLPSLTEGLPLVLAEAMALGLPCIATDCSAGVRLLTDDGRNGRLVPRADGAALAESLATLMADRDERQRLGERAREAMRDYRGDVVIDAWERMISDVLR